jgi:tape measure domain-containing protein
MANTIGTAYIQIAPNMTGVQGKIASGLSGAGSQFAEKFGSEVSGKSAFIIGAIAGVAQAGVTKAMSLVTNSISTAIRRVDTLNSAQKTFQYMGFAADDAAAATKAVTKSILGLPTPLDSAIRGMTSLAATYGDVKLGQKVFTALNNAILGFGGSADMVDNAIQQISQLPLDGPLDAQTWMSLRNSGLTPVLVAMGKDMGKSVSQLKKDFGEGTLTVQDFVNELTKMDTQGGGGLVSLQKIALNATSGIGTGFANLQTAVSRGIANIIQAVGQKNISNAISAIGKAFELALNKVAKAIPVAIGYIKQLVAFIVKYKDIFAPLAVGAAAAATAMIALAVASKVAAAISALQGIVKGAQLAMFTYNAALAQGATAMQAFNIATGANPLSIIIVSLAAVTAALVYFFTKTETGRKIFASFASFMAGVWDKVKSAIKTVADFLGTAWSASVGAVSDAFNAIKDTAKAVFDAIAGFIDDHKRALTNIGIVIGTIVLPKILQIGIQAGIAAAKAIASWVLMAASAVKNAVITSAAWVASAAKSVAAFVVKIPGMIAQFVIASASAIANAAIVTAAWVASSVKTLASWIVTFAGYLAQMAIVVAQTVLAGARMAAAWLLSLGPIGLIVAAVTGAVALIIANWDKVGPFFTGLWEGVKNAVMGAFNWIKSNWPLLLAIITGPIGLAVYAIAKNWQAIKDGAANVINGLVNFFGGLPGRILGAIGNLGSLLYNSGRDMINGLLNGAGSLLSRIGQFFLDKLPGWIQGPFKKALGIHSPSKVFAGYGANIAKGLMGGIDANSNGVTKAVNNMADSAMAGISGSAFDTNISASANVTGGLATQGALGNTTNQTVSIQKVVLGDESAVKAFFGELNQDTINVGMGITPRQGATV